MGINFDGNVADVKPGLNFKNFTGAVVDNAKEDISYLGKAALTVGAAGLASHVLLKDAVNLTPTAETASKVATDVAANTAKAAKKTPKEVVEAALKKMKGINGKNVKAQVEELFANLKNIKTEDIKVKIDEIFKKSKGMNAKTAKESVEKAIKEFTEKANYKKLGLNGKLTALKGKINGGIIKGFDFMMDGTQNIFGKTTDKLATKADKNAVAKAAKSITGKIAELAGKAKNASGKTKILASIIAGTALVLNSLSVQNAANKGRIAERRGL